MTQLMMTKGDELVVFRNSLKVLEDEVFDVFLNGRQLIKLRDVGKLEAIVNVYLRLEKLAAVIDDLIKLEMRGCLEYVVDVVRVEGEAGRVDKVQDSSESQGSYSL